MSRPATTGAQTSVADCSAGPLGAALADRVADLADTVAGSIDRLGDAITPENVHELRIDISRLSAALLVASDMGVRTSQRHLRRRLRRFSRCLSPARDWDVFSTHPAFVRAVNGDDPDIDPLRTELAYRRLEYKDGIALLLRSRSCLGLRKALQRLERESLDPANRLRLAGAREHDRAVAWLGTTLSKVLDAGRHPNRLDVHDLHRMRARVKRLRYASEFLQPLFETDVRPFMDALADLQKNLGRLNDSHVGLRLARDLHPRVASTATLQSIAAQHHGDTARLRKTLQRRLAMLRRLAPFWEPASGQLAVTIAGS